MELTSLSSQSTPSTTESPIGRTRRRSAVVLLAALVASLSLVAVSCTKNAAAYDSVNRINNTRVEAGLRRLAIDDTLVNKAQAWAERMAKAGAISHSQLADGAGDNWRTLGENVGAAGSIAQMHQPCMDSPPHRANIVAGKYDRVGLGVAQAGGRYYVAQVFAG